MRSRGGDVAFYGLLVCVAAAAVALSVVPLHNSSPATPAGGSATAGHTTTVTPTRPRPTAAKHARAAKARPPARLAPLAVDAARGRSWIVLRAGSAAGPVLYRGILEQGRRVQVRRKVVWMQVGAPGSVDVSIGRRHLALDRAVLTGVIVTAKGVAAAQPGSVPVVGS